MSFTNGIIRLQAWYSRYCGTLSVLDWVLSSLLPWHGYSNIPFNGSHSRLAAYPLTMKEYRHVSHSFHSFMHSNYDAMQETIEPNGFPEVDDHYCHVGMLYWAHMHHIHLGYCAAQFLSTRHDCELLQFHLVSPFLLSLTTRMADNYGSSRAGTGNVIHIQ